MMASQKQSVEWLKLCLRNSRSWIEHLHHERMRLTETIQKAEEECDYRQAQIEQAEADGITEFDPKRFKLKKKREAN